ncbi:hypothetical protein BO221_29725 [Archangium sp. Cb G35]|uniref:RICIN domain-containing protein n=1 Tax=Archangium sp. Cb G35 TaxID=1920190 RepID=UPI000936F5B6|nr:RICIN domain-containing protein [Archangium sp. Cb G35]OJT21058.1 hypothetical protein BO221_29725 [Archangium sp. Cb G35]
MSQKYIIQSQQNTNYCFGVLQAAMNQPVVLSYIQGAANPLTQWIMDPNTGLIRLAANQDLYLDVQGTVTQGSQLILSSYIPGRLSQSWNWVGNPPFIANNANPGMVVDNSEDNVSPGNPILIWPQNGGQNQKWTLVSVATHEAFQSRLTSAQPESRSKA